MSNDIKALERELSTLRRRVQELEREKAAITERFKQVDRDRVEYLQNVSHQLVAPLNAIKWHIENLTQARVGIERARKVLRSVYSQATLAVHLAKNFNLMSNLEADHALSALKEPLQEVELCRLLVNLADDFQPLAWDREIQIRVLEDQLGKAPPILAMKPLVRQVFSNIIENAVKYAEPTSTIVIDGRHDGPSGTVAVRVRNRGITLREEDVSRIFDRSFRSAEAKSIYPAGTGFGLYIAGRIVALHEGSIRAGTEAGWVTFTVTLSVRGLEGKARTRA